MKIFMPHAEKLFREFIPGNKTFFFVHKHDGCSRGFENTPESFLAFTDRLFCLFPFRDIPDNPDRTHNLAFLIFDETDGDRNINETSVLSIHLGFKVTDAPLFPDVKSADFLPFFRRIKTGKQFQMKIIMPHAE